MWTRQRLIGNTACFHSTQKTRISKLLLYRKYHTNAFRVIFLPKGARCVMSITFSNICRFLLIFVIYPPISSNLFATAEFSKLQVKPASNKTFKIGHLTHSIAAHLYRCASELVSIQSPIQTCKL